MTTKKKIRNQEASIVRSGKILNALKEGEAKARKKWTKKYQRYMRAADQLAGLSRHGTQKEAKLKKIITSWPKLSAELTIVRDVIRGKIKEEEHKKSLEDIELATLVERIRMGTEAIDEVVNQVFRLNDKVTTALLDRETYLSERVYSELVDDNGEVRTQVTFPSSDGLRKVVAMVNTMTLVLPELAEEAKVKIQIFFDRFKPEQKDNESLKTLYTITQQLLVEKGTFKIGPSLYRFISLDLSDTNFPELKEAQDLLRRSLRSEKTNSYVRLYKKETAHDKWERV